MSQSYIFLPPVVNHQKYAVPIPSAAKNAPHPRLTEYTTLVERFLVHLFSVPPNVSIAFPGCPIAHFRPFISTVLHYSRLLDEHEYIIFAALLLLNKIRERHGKDIQWIFGVQFFVPSLMVATKYHIDQRMYGLAAWAQVAQYVDARKLAEWERSFCAAANWDFVAGLEELREFGWRVKADFGTENKGNRVTEWPMKTKKDEHNPPEAVNPPSLISIKATIALQTVTVLPPGFIPFDIQPHSASHSSGSNVFAGRAMRTTLPPFYQAELPEEQKKRTTSTTAMPGAFPVPAVPVMKVEQLQHNKPTLYLPGLGQAPIYLHQPPALPGFPPAQACPASRHSVPLRWKLF